MASSYHEMAKINVRHVSMTDPRARTGEDTHGPPRMFGSDGIRSVVGYPGEMP